jgi:cytosine/adenosine deaminase-related metal-dependent hydrolase
LRGADGAPVEISVRDGCIAALGQTVGSGVDAVDCAGDLVLPALVDSHLHLDKSLAGLPWQPHAAGPDRKSRIDTEKRMRDALPLSVADRAGALIERLVAQGTGHCRTHVDVDREICLESLEGVIEARDRYAHALSVQIVAFPQSGVLACPGTIEVMEAALDNGADLLGGIDPAGIDGDVDGQLDLIFDLAERKGVEIDIHLHDGGEIGAAEVDAIAKQTRAHGMQGKVAISHGFCLGDIAESDADRRIAAMAEAGITNVTHAPGGSSIPPVKKMHEAGVRIAAGNDGIRDSWCPYGDGDMLQRAMLIGWRSNFRTDPDLELAFHFATSNGADLLGVADYGLAVGKRADFFTLPVETVAEAVVRHPPRSLVVHGGRIVAQGGVYEGSA